MCCSAWEGSVGLTNDGLDLTTLTKKAVSAFQCGFLLREATTLEEADANPLLPLPAGFWSPAGTCPAPALAPSAASAALSAPDGSSLYKYQSAPAAPEWTTGTHPRYHSSTGRQRQRERDTKRELWERKRAVMTLKWLKSKFRIFIAQLNTTLNSFQFRVSKRPNPSLHVSTVGGSWKTHAVPRRTGPLHTERPNRDSNLAVVQQCSSLHHRAATFSIALS